MQNPAVLEWITPRDRKHEFMAASPQEAKKWVDAITVRREPDALLDLTR